MSNSKTLSQSFQQLLDRRLLMVFLLGFSSGFPWVLHGSVMTLWLQSSGLSRSTIGYFGAVATVYAINWAWAPLVDRLSLPLLSRLGQRRSWIILTQFAIMLCLLFLSGTDPNDNLVLVSFWALGIALFSATQDIAVDAYRISIFSKEEADDKMPFAAAVSTTGWWAGYGFLGGAFALFLGGESIGLTWPQVYLVLSGLYIVLMAFVLVIREPEVVISEVPEAQIVKGNLIQHWFKTYIAAPFQEFFARCGFKLAFSIFALLMVFRLGEAMLGRMSLVFYGEIGFTTEQIALYSKFFGGIVTAVFSLLGALVNTRFGVVKGLFVGGIAMASSNLLFALMAVVGPNVNLLIVTLVIDNFSAAFATVAFISFISYFTSRTYTGTQYALMASISNFGRTTLAASSGGVVDYLDGDWSTFFILTALMVIPGLMLLIWIGKQIRRYDDERVLSGEVSADSRRMS